VATAEPGLASLHPCQRCQDSLLDIQTVNRVVSRDGGSMKYNIEMLVRSTSQLVPVEKRLLGHETCCAAPARLCIWFNVCIMDQTSRRASILYWALAGSSCTGSWPFSDVALVPTRLDRGCRARSCSRRMSRRAFPHKEYRDERCLRISSEKDRSPR
jgi:hypothetical protein